jgi:transcriptional regulator with XRE-family HTH domain
VTDEPQLDWFLREWLTHFGKRQAALVNELGWNKQRASYVWNSRQSYRREVVNEIAQWLGIRPFELLMPPREALALRRLRETAAAIVAEDSAEWDTKGETDPPA